MNLEKSIFTLVLSSLALFKKDWLFLWTLWRINTNVIAFSVSLWNLKNYIDGGSLQKPLILVTSLIKHINLDWHKFVCNLGMKSCCLFQGEMIVLDLYSEIIPIFTRTESYYGQPFIWCMLHDFGGTMELYGALKLINEVY